MINNENIRVFEGNNEKELLSYKRIKIFTKIYQKFKKINGVMNMPYYTLDIEYQVKKLFRNKFTTYRVTLFESEYLENIVSLFEGMTI